MRRFVIISLLLSTALIGLWLFEPPHPAQALWADYLERLPRPLNLNTSEKQQQPPTLPLPSYPERRLRLLEEQPLREGLLDTLDFAECDLLGLISERNSSLAKVADSAWKLAYELRFLTQADQCLSRPPAQRRAETENFYQLLAQVSQHKRQQLPRLLANLLYNSAESEAQFSLAQTPLLPLEDDGAQASLQALAFLQQLTPAVLAIHRGAPAQPLFQLSELEQHLAALYHSRFGSKLLQSLQLSGNSLAQASLWLQLRMARRPLCYHQQASEEGRILFNVLLRYYAQSGQQELSRLQRQGEAWRAGWLTLQELLPPPKVVADYLHSLWIAEDGSWRRWQASIQQHQQQWQQLLNSCGLAPGQASQTD
ncbi:DUF3080 family protein [Balneatrix alpica]|uniref:DUF3080 family protein n=1 Tax=Balneatrix alpica TaxID=75684 RepID=UPI002739654A|nr:DUF3080 family protein [Balneatrix alpica]